MEPDVYNPEPTASQIVGLVDGLLAQAVKARASDLHFEPTGADLVVRFRLDGVLKDVSHLPQTIAENVVSRLKVLGGCLPTRMISHKRAG